MYRYPPVSYPPPTQQLSEPKSSNSNVKIVAIVLLFICVFGALLMAMLAGSNPLSHKTSKNNKPISKSASNSTSKGGITNNIEPSLAKCSIM